MNRLFPFFLLVGALVGLLHHEALCASPPAPLTSASRPMAAAVGTNAPDCSAVMEGTPPPAHNPHDEVPHYGLTLSCCVLPLLASHDIAMTGVATSTACSHIASKTIILTGRRLAPEPHPPEG